MADPTEREYYERRYTASGEGSDFEKNTRLAALAAGGGIFLIPSRKSGRRASPGAFLGDSKPDHFGAP